MGKSATIIRAAVELGAKRVLVVTSNRGTLTWDEEVRKWANPEYATVVLGTRAQRIKKLRELNTTFAVVPYGMIRHSKKKPIPKEILNGKWDVIAFDEAHRLCGRKSQQTAGAKLLAKKHEYVWLATGSPIRNRPDEIWQLLNILYPRDFRSFWKFVEHFCFVKSGVFGMEIGGLQQGKRDEWFLTVGQHMVHRKKEDYLKDLPPKIYDVEWLEMTPIQARITKQLRKEMMASISWDNQGNIILASNTAELAQKIRMVSTSPRLIGDEDWGNKIPRTVELLQEHDGQAVVFAYYRGSVTNMHKALSDENIDSVYVMGGMPDWVANQRVQDFRDGNVKVLIATIGCLSESVNLQNADLMIFLERDYVPENNGQAEDRIHRAGQTRPCVYIDLLNQRSIDVKIQRILQKKTKIVNEAMAIRQHFEELFGDDL